MVYLQHASWELLMKDKLLLVQGVQRSSCHCRFGFGHAPLATHQVHLNPRGWKLSSHSVSPDSGYIQLKLAYLVILWILVYIEVLFLVWPQLPGFLFDHKDWVGFLQGLVKQGLVFPLTDLVQAHQWTLKVGLQSPGEQMMLTNLKNEGEILAKLILRY